MGLVTLTFDRLTLKLVCESPQRWGTFLPNLGTLGLWVLELFATYATDGQKQGLFPPSLRGRSIIKRTATFLALCVTDAVNACLKNQHITHRRKFYYNGTTCIWTSQRGKAQFSASSHIGRSSWAWMVSTNEIVSGFTSDDRDIWSPRSQFNSLSFYWMQSAMNTSSDLSPSAVCRLQATSS